MEHYLDNSATTRVSEAAAKKVFSVMRENYGNPSSLHSLGIRAENELSDARDALAKALSVDSDEIFFTSGGTEANNLAVFGAAKWLRRRGNKIVTTAVEHSSVLEAAKQLGEEGFEVVYINPDENGKFTAEQFLNAVDEKTILVSVMAVNNEIGTILPVEKLRAVIDKKRSPAVLHCDMVQAFGKIPLKPARLGFDLATVSGHKIHAPKGVGALYVRKGARIKPMHFGGEQEKRLRPGTEAVPLIAGFGEAVKAIDIPKSYSAVQKLNAFAKERLGAVEGVVFNSPDDALPYIINISALGVRSETMLHFLASREIYVSSGSACAKGKPSHVLSAMGLDRNRADSALRISFSAENTEADVEALAEALREGLNTLVKRKKI